MKTTGRLEKLAGLLIVALLTLACMGGAFVTLTETPTLSPTPPATNTATPRPSSTPRPTKTAFPTPAALGMSIDADGFSFTVIKAVSLRRIYPGGKLVFSPKAGYFIIDIGLRIQNKTAGDTITIPWENIYVTEANGDSWYPIWGTAKFVDRGAEIDPYTLGISSEEIKGADKISFTADAYLRLIFIVKDNNNKPVPVMFGIGDAPKVAMIVEQPK